MTVRVAQLTAPGRSALASLAVEGPGAWDILRPLFRTMKGGELTDPPATGRFRLGRLGTDLADEVVLAHVGGRFEVHCHGGREVVRMLLEALADRGAQIVGWKDLTADVALRLLPFAPTAKTAAILLDQHQGAFMRSLQRILAALPDDRELRELAGRIPLGAHLTTPWRVAVAGAPNVGKSSLINALAGYTRSVVAPTPGTTRDLVRVPVALDGWPVELIDTAGLRDEAGPLEEQGIALARAEVATADLCVWVLDATSDRPELPPDTMPPTLCVINKVDVPAAWDTAVLASAPRASARTGVGVGELVALIAAALVPDPPGPGAAVPITPEQSRVVMAALAAVERGDVHAAREELAPHVSD